MQSTARICVLCLRLQSSSKCNAFRAHVLYALQAAHRSSRSRWPTQSCDADSAFTDTVCDVVAGPEKTASLHNCSLSSDVSRFPCLAGVTAGLHILDGRSVRMEGSSISGYGLDANLTNADSRLYADAAPRSLNVTGPPPRPLSDAGPGFPAVNAPQFVALQEVRCAPADEHASTVPTWRSGATGWRCAQSWSASALTCIARHNLAGCLA
jgi:hypothetical protein